MMNALKQLQKYERLAEFAHKAGLYNCARKWSLKAEKLEAVINALESIKEVKQVELVKLEGSEKQAAWASSIREDKLTAIREIAEKDPSTIESVDQAIEWLSQKSNSKWWIENRSNPGVAFLAYANYQASNTAKLSFNFYQSATRIGGQIEEKLIPCDMVYVKKTKAIDSVGIKTTLHKDKTIECEIGQLDELEGGHAAYVYSLIDVLPGSTQDLDAVIVRCFKSCDRMGTSEDLTAWGFVKVKEFAKVG